MLHRSWYLETALMCLAVGCAGDEHMVSVSESELVVERRIDGNSPFWMEAPPLFEGPFTCPLPAEALAPQVAMAHESLTIQNAGSATAIEIRLEGSSYDAALSAEPLLMVYAGPEVPHQAAGIASCLGIDKPGGGQPGSVMIPVATGDIITAIAVEPEIGPGVDGSGSGTFRLRVVPY